MEEMKKGMCELCSKKARLHCESDQARLCWECDEKVHGANFLVAKHCRSVLCHVCQSTTPWKASGPKLFPTISLCGNCSANKNSRIEEEEEEEEINQPQIRDQENGVFEEVESEDDDENQEYSSSDDDEEEYEDEECDEVEEDDGENQVVPWAPSPPLAASSSSSEEEVAADGVAAAVSSTFKRICRTDYLDSQDDEINSSQNCGMSSLSSSRPWKLARNNGDAM